MDTKVAMEEDPDINNPPEEEQLDEQQADAKLKVALQDPRAHYENVKKKYFMSLGMNKPVGPPSAEKKKEPARGPRTKTQPPPVSMFMMDEDPFRAEDGAQTTSSGSMRSKRSVSTPIPVSALGTTPVAVPMSHDVSPVNQHSSGSGPRSEDSDEELYENEEDVESPTQVENFSTSADRKKKHFIPPHELLAKKSDFNVGTARSVTVWENRRRTQLDQGENW